MHGAEARAGGLERSSTLDMEASGGHAARLLLLGGMGGLILGLLLLCIVFSVCQPKRRSMNYQGVDGMEEDSSSEEEQVDKSNPPRSHSRARPLRRA